MPPANKPKLTLATKVVILVTVAAILQIALILLTNDKLLLIGGSILIFGLVFGTILHFIQRFDSLLQIARLYLQGNFQTPLKVTSGDEMGELSLVINEFSDHIKASTTRIKQYTDSTEIEKLKVESIMNAVSDGVIALDFNHQVIMINSAAQKLTGYQNEELENKPLESLVRFNDKDGIKIDVSSICNPNNAGQNALPQSLTLVGKNNTQNVVKIISSQISAQTPSNLKCILIMHDANTEKSMLGIQIDFVSMASHELRTPLTSIISYLSVFMDENKTKFTPDQMQFLDRIMISAKQLSNLIENLLNVSKVERNAFSLTTQHVDWQAILHKGVEDNRLQASQKNITLSLDATGFPLPKVQADPIRIVEVLNNLISNAVNYTKEGGQITVGAKVENNEVVTFIKDSGVGIPQEAISHLFTKFYRVKGALDTSSNSKGTGLGLYLSKAIVDLHHGRIWVTSTVGQGSTFSFTLPIVKEEPLPASLTLPTAK